MNKAILKILSRLDIAVVDETSGRVYIHSIDLTEELETVIELTVNQCLNVIHTQKHCPDKWSNSHEGSFQQGCNMSIEHIKEHFDIE